MSLFSNTFRGNSSSNLCFIDEKVKYFVNQKRFESTSVYFVFSKFWWLVSKGFSLELKPFTKIIIRFFKAILHCTHFCFHRIFLIFSRLLKVTSRKIKCHFKKMTLAPNTSHKSLISKKEKVNSRGKNLEKCWKVL